jgi:hypothetical protein
MNLYPSWIHRIPEMIEALKLHPGERVDRQTVENLFDLRKTAAFYLLRCSGASARNAAESQSSVSPIPYSLHPAV